MANDTPTLPFIEQLIRDELNKSGLADLSSDDQAELIPQFVAQAEVRIGAVLLSKLNEENARHMQSMVEKGATPAEWATFWTTAVPDIEAVVTPVIAQFVHELRGGAEE